MQLRAIQEVLGLGIFCLFCNFYLGEPITWNQGVGLALIGLGAYFIFSRW
jgi:uncharacterized protein (DUF486 family)